MKTIPDPLTEISTRLGGIETRLSTLESRIEALLVVASVATLPTHVSIGDAAKMTGVTRWAIQKKLRHGQLEGEANPVTGRVMIPLRQVNPWLAEAIANARGRRVEAQNKRRNTALRESAQTTSER